MAADEIGLIAVAVSIISVRRRPRRNRQRCERLAAQRGDQPLPRRGVQAYRFAFQPVNQRADANAFIHRRAALILRCAVMQRHQLPFVIENRRAGRASVGIRRVVQHVGRLALRRAARQQKVIAQRHLLRRAAGMLNDIYRHAQSVFIGAIAEGNQP